MLDPFIYQFQRFVEMNMQCLQFQILRPYQRRNGNGGQMHPSPLHLPYILFGDCISVQTGMECNSTPSPTFTVYTLWRSYQRPNGNGVPQHHYRIYTLWKVPEAKLILHVTLHLPRLLKQKHFYDLIPIASLQQYGIPVSLGFTLWTFVSH